MKIVVLFLALAALLLGQERPGNFNIRFEPTARLQTEADIPFQITVTDQRNQPLVDAKVTLQIETAEHTQVKIFKAPAINPGVYMAKPIFPSPGTWTVLVQVQRNDQVSTRTSEFNVPRNAE